MLILEGVYFISWCNEIEFELNLGIKCKFRTGFYESWIKVKFEN